MVTHDEGAVDALRPDRVLLLPDAAEDRGSEDYRDLIAPAWPDPARPGLRRGGRAGGGVPAPRATAR